MRTTIDVDDQLLAQAQARFPPGTPKTVVFEEGLRRLVATPPRAQARHPLIEELVGEGVIIRPAKRGDLPERHGRVSREAVLADLDASREDR